MTMKAVAAPVRRGVFVWPVALVLPLVMFGNAFGYARESSFIAVIAVGAGVLTIGAAWKNWRMNWNWFGCLLRASLGERSARIVLGLCGAGFTIGGVIGAFSA